MSEGGTAEALYREAIERLGRYLMSAPSLPVRIYFTANGYAADADAATREKSCASLGNCSRRWRWRDSRSEPGANCSPPARPRADG